MSASSTRTRDSGDGVSDIASGSRLLKEERFSAQAISQLLQATHRSALTKMDFIALPEARLYPATPIHTPRVGGKASRCNFGAQAMRSCSYQ